MAQTPWNAVIIELNHLAMQEIAGPTASSISLNSLRATNNHSAAQLVSFQLDVGGAGTTVYGWTVELQAGEERNVLADAPDGVIVVKQDDDFDAQAAVEDTVDIYASGIEWS